LIRRFFQIFLVLLSAGFVFSCGSTKCEEDGCGEVAQENQGITLRIVDNSCVANTIGAHNYQNLGSITFTVSSAEGKLIFQKSFKKEDIASSMEISGIDDVSGATVTISGFGTDSNEVKWTGKITNMNFKAGKETSINAVLYPTSGQACLPDPLTIPRFGHTATLLQDGRILLTGGFTSCSAVKCPASRSVEIIDVESGKIETLNDMNEERAMHEAVLLSDGSVIIFGGVRQMDLGSFAVAGYPVLPYSFSIQATTVERYVPSYPKLNMKNNNIGTVVPNSTVDMGLSFAAMPFYPFQTYYVQNVSETQKTVYLVGGMGKDLAPINKIYAFDIVEAVGSVTLSAAREVAPVDKDTMLSPATGVSSNALFSTGGRALTPTSVASFYSATAATAWEGTGPNLFYTRSLVVDENLYTFGGLENTDDNALANNKKAHSWNIAQKAVTASDKNITAWGPAVFFSDVIYDTAKSNFMVIGGAGGSQSEPAYLNAGTNIYQVITKNNFSIAPSPLTYPMKFNRILPRGTIDKENGKVFITGGISKLGSAGAAVGAIEINVIK
jgi:hypothetical protein